MAPNPLHPARGHRRRRTGDAGRRPRQRVVRRGARHRHADRRPRRGASLAAGVPAARRRAAPAARLGQDQHRASAQRRRHAEPGQGGPGARATGSCRPPCTSRARRPRAALTRLRASPSCSEESRTGRRPARWWRASTPSASAAPTPTRSWRRRPTAARPRATGPPTAASAHAVGAAAPTPCAPRPPNSRSMCARTRSCTRATSAPPSTPPATTGPTVSPWSPDGDLAERLDAARTADPRVARVPRPGWCSSCPGQGTRPGAGPRPCTAGPRVPGRLDEASALTGPVCGRTLAAVVSGPRCDPAELARTEVAQPLLVAFGVALARQLRGVGGDGRTRWPGTASARSPPRASPGRSPWPRRCGSPPNAGG